MKNIAFQLVVILSTTQIQPLVVLVLREAMLLSQPRHLITWFLPIVSSTEPFK